MKRQDIIKRLITEGFTEKTLVNFTDKQLNTLVTRIISEDSNVINIPKTDTGAINDAKNQKKVFSTYESEVIESDLDDDQDNSENEEKDDRSVTWDEIAKSLLNVIVRNQIIAKGNYGFSLNESDGTDHNQMVMRRLLFKIDHAKDSSKLKDWVRVMKTINNGEIPEEISKVLEKTGVSVDDETVSDWVDDVIQEKYFSSKKDIMEVIQNKIKEQAVLSKPKTKLPKFFTYDSIMSTSGAEPLIKPKTPTTKPGERQRPKHPLQPGKVPNPKPKAKIIPENKRKK